MFIIYKSNNINMLLSTVCEIIKKKPLSNIFEKEIFVYDQKILFKYINIFIAKKMGISANLAFYHPDDFIWKLFTQFLLGKKIKNIFTENIMIWKIMKILDKKTFEFFNKKKTTIEKFKYSIFMAKIFSQYLVYRYDLIHKWEIETRQSNIDENEKWQIKLWQEILNNNKKKINLLIILQIYLII